MGPHVSIMKQSAADIPANAPGGNGGIARHDRPWLCRDRVSQQCSGGGATPNWMADRNRLADTGLHAVDNFFFECGCAASFICLAADRFQRHRAALEERRHVVDALVEQTLALASEKRVEKALELRNKWEQVKELRPFLDHALSRSRKNAIRPFPANG